MSSTFQNVKLCIRSLSVKFEGDVGTQASEAGGQPCISSPQFPHDLPRTTLVCIRDISYIAW